MATGSVSCRVGPHPAAYAAGSPATRYANSENALVVCLANLGVTGNVKLPSDKADCAKLLELVNARLEMARARFRELAESRTGDERVRKQLQKRWSAGSLSAAMVLSGRMLAGPALAAEMSNG